MTEEIEHPDVHIDLDYLGRIVVRMNEKDHIIIVDDHFRALVTNLLQKVTKLDE